jgi:hypothetical protein
LVQLKAVKFAGLMQLPLKQLVQPPKESRLIREPDPTFVKNLKQKMLSDPAAPGATPMAVLCKGVDDFNSRHKDVYKYEVLGGCTQCWQKFSSQMNIQTILISLLQRLKSIWVYQTRKP